MTGETGDRGRAAPRETGGRGPAARREPAGRTSQRAPRIKLCGVRRVSDAVLCAEAGADEIGVVLAPARRRRVTFDEARAIRAALPAEVAMVGVFLDATLAELIEAVRAVPLSAVQLHGKAPGLAALAGLGLPVYRAVQVDGRSALDAVGVGSVVGGAGGALGGVGSAPGAGSGEAGSDAPRPAALGDGAPGGRAPGEGPPSGYARLLLDGPGSGGAGASFDWALARAARSRTTAPLFVAGGLTPENVAAAVRLSAADGVDVSSGIEGSDGFKDAARVRDFVAAATAAFDSGL